MTYEADFELWLPVSGGNGRFWFSVLNRGNDIGGLRDHESPRIAAMAQRLALGIAAHREGERGQRQYPHCSRTVHQAG